MTATPASALQQHPAFQGLSAASLKRLESDVRLLRYQPGQPLSAAALVPSEVLLIQEGQARLLVRDQERPSTLRRLGSGDLVGLASLLRASGCEDVAASTLCWRWQSATPPFCSCWRRSLLSAVVCFNPVAC